MNLSPPTLEALAFVISGDKPTERSDPVSPYRTARQLEEFFRDFVPAHSPMGGPSRLNFTRELLRHHREAGNLRGVLEAALDPMSYRNPDRPSHDVAVEFLQDYLERDGYQVTFDGGRCRVAPKGIVAQVATHVDDDVYARMIGDYLAESERRLADGDHDGVITLARTMVEAALQRMEAKLDPDPPKWDGDLPALYKRVSRTLNIGTDRTDIRDNLVGVLRGLQQIVAGLSPYRNNASDAHATTHRAPEHHARLALNAARTIVDFINATFQFQQAAGRLNVNGTARP